MRRLFKKLGLFAVIFFSFLGATAMNAQAQRRIDPHYPLWGVVDNNRDIPRGADSRIKSDSRNNGNRGYGGIIQEVLIGILQSRAENARKKTEQNESESEPRSSRGERSERSETEERSRSKELIFVNGFAYPVEIILDGEVIEYSKGTLLYPNHLLHIEVPVERDYEVYVVVHTPQGKKKVNLVQKGNYLKPDID